MKKPATTSALPATKIIHGAFYRAHAASLTDGLFTIETNGCDNLHGDRELLEWASEILDTLAPELADIELKWGKITEQGWQSGLYAFRLVLPAFIFTA